MTCASKKRQTIHHHPPPPPPPPPRLFQTKGGTAVPEFGRRRSHHRSYSGRPPHSRHSSCIVIQTHQHPKQKGEGKSTHRGKMRRNGTSPRMPLAFHSDHTASLSLSSFLFFDIHSLVELRAYAVAKALKALRSRPTAVPLARLSDTHFLEEFTAVLGVAARALHSQRGERERERVI